MIGFLLQEGVITIGTISGIFTALLLNSLKHNIIDPIVEKVSPTPIPEKKPNLPEQKEQKEQKEQMQPSAFSAAGITCQFGGPSKTTLNVRLFIRDFLTWLVIMIILYIVWKHIVHPYKSKFGVNVPPKS